MMWLRREMAKRDMQQPPAPSPIENNPVGWSSIYPPQVVTNASPDFSPLANPGQFTNEQRLGAFWNLATRRAKPYTNRDLPQLAAAGNEAVDAAMNWAGMTTPVVKGLRAYHGSPHTFDRFDLSKIGTGEGAQAYGHGLYFAGNEAVAKGYRDALATPRVSLDGAALSSTTGNFSDALADAWRRGKITPQQEEALSYVVGAPSLDDAIANLRAQARMPMRIGTSAAKEWNARADALEALRPRLEVQPTGSMYEVNLRTSPERLLDWDKPLSQQPGAAAAYRNIMDGDAARTAANYKGKDFYNDVLDIAEFGYDPTRVSKELRSAGLDGIQYLDAGSRAAGEGSRNYVMFRDDIIDILKRYGLFGLGMVGASQAGPYGAENP